MAKPVTKKARQTTKAVKDVAASVLTQTPPTRKPPPKKAAAQMDGGASGSVARFGSYQRMPPGMLDKKTRRHVARNVGVASFTIESTKGGLAQPNPLSKLVLQPLKLFRASAQDRVDLLHLGIPASVVGDLADRMRVSRETLYDTLRLPRSSVIARIRAGEALPQEQAERVIGLAKLIGQVEALVEEAGDPAGFDAYRWMGQWMERTIPALGGKTPRSYMDSMTGQGIVSNLVEMIQSGAEA